MAKNYLKEWSSHIRKEKKTIYCNPDIGDIEPIDVENYNEILRERIGG
ncbi:MAG: hypothetical protein ACT6FC_01245 [Methanosarcinaceae archaeon]